MMENPLLKFIFERMIEEDPDHLIDLIMQANEETKQYQRKIERLEERLKIYE